MRNGLTAWKVGLWLALWLPVLSASADNFWTADVWKDDDRGFLFYGPDAKASQEKPVPLSTLTTVEALHAERDRRLNAAVMDPTMENMAAYQEINTLMLEKSALFAEMYLSCSSFIGFLVFRILFICVFVKNTHRLFND